MRCGVLGAGSWGTALAVQLSRQGHEVRIWDRNHDRVETINQSHKNPRYLKTVALPPNLVASSDLSSVAAFADLLVPVVPSHGLREVLRGCQDAVAGDTVVCCATKGLEEGTLDTVYQVACDSLPSVHSDQITVLSGPSFALEVAEGLPTAVVIAGVERFSHIASEAFHGDRFRVYHTEDVTGVCLGGSLKNVMAIACGVSDGAGLGTNARAGLITRGLAEVTRLATDFGAHPMTMMGLAGMGDLVLTCTGKLSRNRRVGLGLGKGQTLSEVLSDLGEVAEGVRTSRSAVQLARQRGIEMPISEAIYSVLYESKPVKDALEDLMRRGRRAERDE